MAAVSCELLGCFQWLQRRGGPFACSASCPTSLPRGRCTRALCTASLRCPTVRAGRKPACVGQLCVAGRGWDPGSFSLAVLGGSASSEQGGPARWRALLKVTWLGMMRTELGLSRSQDHVFQRDLCLSKMHISGPYPRTTESDSLEECPGAVP